MSFQHDSCFEAFQPAPPCGSRCFQCAPRFERSVCSSPPRSRRLRFSLSPAISTLRSARPVDVIASAKVTKQGRRMVNVFAEAWQDDRSKPVATANAHFLVTSADEPPAL